MQILVGENNKILRNKSTKVEKIDKSVKKLVAEMKETLILSEGIGLAAPQVGVNLDIIIVKIDQKSPLVMLNPEVLDQSKELEICEEGCLSLPGIWGNVERPKEIKLKFIDEKNRSQIVILKKLNARIVLHEMDHLEGILFTDRIIKQQKDENILIKGE